MLLLSCAAGAGQVEATSGPSAVPRTAMDALREMEARAGVVFAGEVMSIRIEGPDAAGGLSEFGGDGVVDVSLQVEDAIRGCSPGQRYVLREWAALWRNQPGRYRVGQRAVWLLYPPNAGGLSSPVGGMMGVLPMSGRGDRTQVDMRWIQARSLRNFQPSPVSDTAAGSSADPGAAFPTEPPQMAYKSLMGAIRTMEASNHAAQ